MSRFNQRKEKNCLNCGTTVLGKYCQNCGQENIEPHQSFWQLLKHYFEDLTHFDGKFFETTGYLVSRPGLLPAEYIKGKRTSYLNPVRMYIFTSALFFFVFFASQKDNHNLNMNSTINGKNYEEALKLDSVQFAHFTRDINLRFGNNNKPMSRAEWKQFYDSLGVNGTGISKIKYHSRAEMDSAIAGGREKHLGWLEKKIRYREIELGNKYGSSYSEIGKVLQQKFLHSLPQLIFISLPLTALILLLFYYRFKQFYYADHFIFSLHLYIFLFIVLLFNILLKKLDANTSVTIFSWLNFGLWLWFWMYVLISLKRFYHQRWPRTVLKYFLLLFTIAFMLVLLFVFSLILFFLFFV